MLRKIAGFAAALMLLMPIGVKASAAAKTAAVNAVDVIVDDGIVMAAGYVIEDYTYYKLRDIAYIMQGKSCQFSAGYNAETRSIVLQKGGSYQPDGLELQPLQYGRRPAIRSDMPVFIDGQKAAMDAYNIDGYAYYKLRDLGRMLGFQVAFDGSGGFIQITTPGAGQKADAAGQTEIMGKAVATAKQMARYCRSKSPVPQLPYCTVEELAQMFLDEGSIENVRGDIAFAQALKETSFFRYGGIVLPAQNNYAGIGALNSNAAGQAASFPDPRTGVRAQIQHLKAYASTRTLLNPCVDPRFTLVPRGSAPYVEWLGAADNPSGKGWAIPGIGYGVSIVNMLNTIAAF